MERHLTVAQRHHAVAPEVIATLLSQPVDDSTPVEPRLRSSLVARLHALSPPRHAPRMRLDAFIVEHGAAVKSTPFAWSARTARRSLGTRAARLIVSGDEPDVLTAAEHEIDRQCDRALRGLVRPGALAAWLAATKGPLRAECAIEAASWAAGLLMLLAPERTGIRVGIADAWFDIPGARTTLHARRDAASPRRDGSRGGILRCSDGTPGLRAVDGLVVDGLVAALSTPDVVPPSRVLGAWPDAGVVLSVEIDSISIRRGAGLLVQCARARHDNPDRSSELVAA
jgi:hypothetical protein